MCMCAVVYVCVIVSETLCTRGIMYKTLPESDSISCFFCIFLSSHEPEKPLFDITLVVLDTHTHTENLQDKSAQSFFSFPTGLQRQTTLPRVCHILNHYQIVAQHCTLHVCVCVCYSYVSSHPSSQALETVVSLNDTPPLSPVGLKATEQTSLSLSDLNQTAVFC